MATHSSFLVWRVLADRVSLGATVHGVGKSWLDTTEFYLARMQCMFV